MHDASHSSRRLLGILAAGGLGLLGGSILASGYRFELNRYHASLPGLKAPLRLVQLSDLHFGLYIFERSLERWVDAAMAEHPDLIVITGDFIDTRVLTKVTPLLRQLERLKAPLGVWGVWGNHDHRGARNLAGLKKRLEDAGVRLLENDGRLVREDLFLAGVDDLSNGRPRLDKALAGRPAESACLLLSHTPDFLPRVPRSVGLTLCGHTHGGQVKLPFVGPLTTSSRYGKRFAEGWIGEPVRAFVSRGLGFSMLPLRFNCPAELVRFDLFPDTEAR